MVTLYRPPADAAADAHALADEAEAALRDMVIAHRVVAPEDASADAPDARPALVDDGEVVTGAEAVHARLDDLRALMHGWHAFQGDACHVDDDGTVCGPYETSINDGPSRTAAFEARRLARERALARD
jgi:hypothetical protein